MIRKGINFFSSIILNNLKFIVIKILHPLNFKFNFLNFISPLASIDILNNGVLKLGKKCRILSGTTLGVRESGKLVIGDNTFINKNCQIISHQKIIIGCNVKIGPNVVILDHDHIFSSEKIEKKKFKCEDVEIGDNVWIGAGVIILRGTKIGSNTIIGAGSLLKSDVPSNSIVIQKRNSTITKIEKSD